MFRNNKLSAGHWIGIVAVVLFVVLQAPTAMRDLKDMRDFQTAYQYGAAAGKDQTINQIIGMGKDCQPVQLFSGQDKDRVVITFANVDCDEVATPEAATPVTTPEQ